MDRGRALWVIDGGYLFFTQQSIGRSFQFDYLKLREYVERDGPIWRAYYLNATRNAPSDEQNGFHRFLRSASPYGPKIITKLYQVQSQRVDLAYCEICQERVSVRCPNDDGTGAGHRLVREQQKGVDVGMATLALTLKDDYDTLILSSGDSDLNDVVEYLSLNGKRIELVVFRNGVATELQCRADRIYWIDEFADEVRHAQSDIPNVRV